MFLWKKCLFKWCKPLKPRKSGKIFQNNTHTPTHTHMYGDEKSNIAYEFPWHTASTQMWNLSTNQKIKNLFRPQWSQKASVKKITK